MVVFLHSSRLYCGWSCVCVCVRACVRACVHEVLWCLGRYVLVNSSKYVTLKMLLHLMEFNPNFTYREENVQA
jgi:hypothetical protein